ncbi:MAG TPA: indole-3-glycerol phosphate synthase TrpC [Oligoflexia bacterium]|nr:indole-3-glycerol phosphate synthase TrpC [Oligoflexia bacterium]
MAKIVERKKNEVLEAKSAIPVPMLEKMPGFFREVISLKDVFLEKRNSGFSPIIAEIKRASPSRGIMHVDLDVEKLATAYQSGGAVAISILTDREGFGGTAEDIKLVRDKVFIPVLRKDFIVDPYQVYESRAIGADIILLIASAITPNECFSLSGLAKSLGLDVLLEIHEEHEVENYNNEYVDFVGINNRNLKTLKVDIETSVSLFDKLPKSSIKISESGISEVSTLVALKNKGFDLFLVGEIFMREKNPGEAFLNFVRDFRNHIS